MRKIIIIRLLVYFMILFVVSCQPQQPAIPTHAPAATVTTTPSPLPTETLISAYDMPDVAIVVDNSYSMIEPGPKPGSSCDSTVPGKRMRYLIADFLVRIISDLKSKGIVSKNQKTQLLFLDRSGFAYFDDSRSNDSLHQELVKRNNLSQASDETDHGIFHGLQQFFDSTPDPLKLTPNTKVFFITDGDFRKIRKPNYDWTPSAKDVVGGVSNLSSTKNAQFYFLLVCDDRISDSNLDGKMDRSILDKWDNEVAKFAYIYHFANGSLSGKLQELQWSALQGMVDEFFQSTDFSSDSAASAASVIGSDPNPLLAYSVVGSHFGRGWGMTDHGGSLIIPGNAAMLSAGGIPFDESEKVTVTLNTQSYQGGFSGIPLSPSHTFLPNACGRHKLQIDNGGYRFYWWQATFPIFTIGSDNNDKTLYFQNGEKSKVPLGAYVDLPDGTPTDFSSFDWNDWRPCLQFQVDGKTLEQNADGPMLFMERSDTVKNATLDIEWHGWDENDQSEDIKLQTLSFTYLSTIVPKLIDKPNVIRPGSLNKDSGLALDYDGYQPAITETNLNPTISFETGSNSKCSLSKIYSPEPLNQFSLIFARTANGYEIRFPNDPQGGDYDYSACEKMTLTWPKNWPGADHDHPVDLACKLSWDGNILIRAECHDQ